MGPAALTWQVHVYTEDGDHICARSLHTESNIGQNAHGGNSPGHHADADDQAQQPGCMAWVKSSLHGMSLNLNPSTQSLSLHKLAACTWPDDDDAPLDVYLDGAEAGSGEPVLIQDCGGSRGAWRPHTCTRGELPPRTQDGAGDGRDPQHGQNDGGREKWDECWCISTADMCPLYPISMAAIEEARWESACMHQGGGCITTLGGVR
ncbi:hypothetical protein B0H10DRAFT_1948537 [Mycena sp. CBHHK59/15]|nr:hypothetical protein B0H10DRAFT_1948537 [Mycena sp. CBHHK59/15]